MAPSFFEGRTLGGLYREIQDVYLSDARPWILGFSGGKDSTCMIQIVWNALLRLPRERLAKRVFVISSDTLVESPKIVETVTGTLGQMEAAGKRAGLPISTNLVRPVLGETFWVCLLGKGYPAPSTTFRWCTDRLKISSANRFIEEKVSEHGEVVMVLGSRSDESSTRAQVLSLHRIGETPLSKHDSLTGAYIYPPLRDFTTQDVWNYLLQNSQNPWGGNNRDLLALYKDANAAECPLVVDTSTQSCGNSRFGCWTCTVVERDRSMEGMIDSGETWMEPLLELREELKRTQDPEVKKEVRELRHRNGSIIFWKGRVARGNYRLDYCQGFLRRLLEAEARVRRDGPDPSMELIGRDEIREIQRIWRMERGDWKNSAYAILEEVTGERLEAGLDDAGALGASEQEELEAACRGRPTPPVMMARLINAEFEARGAGGRQRLHSQIEKILREEWREDDEEVLGDARKKMAMVEEAR